MITVIEEEWGLSNRKLVDRRLATQVYDIVAEKTSTAKKLDLTTEIRCGHVYFYLTLLGARGLGAQILHGPEGQSLTVFSDQDVPALALETEPNSDMVTVHYAGDQPSTELIERRVGQLRDLFLATPEKRPYGWWGEDGRITALFFNASIRYDDKVERFVGGEPYGYVLKGTPMPELLRMFGKEDADGWVQRVVHAIQEGKLIPLRERIHDLPGEIWSIGDGEHGYLLFEKGDDMKPQLVAGESYIQWHPLEAYPGELFSISETGKMPLRKWLSW